MSRTPNTQRRFRSARTVHVVLRVLTIFAIFYAASAVAIALSDVFHAKNARGGPELRLALIAGAILVSGGLASVFRDLSSTTTVVVVTMAAAVTLGARAIAAVHGTRTEG